MTDKTRSSEKSTVAKILEDFNNYISTSKRSDSFNSTFNLEDTIPFWKRSFSQGSDSSVLHNEDAVDSQMKTIELICTKNVINKLQTKIEATDLARKRARIEYESEKEINELHTKTLKQKNEELQKEVCTLIEKQVETRNELNNLRQSFTAERLSLQEKIQKIQQEKILSENKSEERLSSAKDTIFELNEAVLNHEKYVKKVTLENEMLKEQLQFQTKKNENLIEQTNELQKFKDTYMELSNQVKVLKETLAKHEDLTSVNRILLSEINELKEDKKENERLKKENHLLREERENVLLLQEKIDGLEKALQRSEKRCSVMNELQIKNEEIIAKLKEWESLDTSLNEKSPRKVAKFIAQLQSKEAIMSSQYSELSTKVNILTKEKKELENRIHILEEEIKVKAVKLQMSMENVKRLQKKLLLVTKERDSYQHVLNSYEKEVTLNTSAIVNERIHELENIVEICHRQNVALEAELNLANEKILDKLEGKHTAAEMHEKLASVETKNKSLEKQVQNLEESISKLQQENESLNDRLEYRALKGDYDPSTTKVVHFKVNPLSTAVSKQEFELEELRKENRRLLERIKMLQQHSSGNESSLSDSDKSDTKQNLSFNKEIDVLRKKLQSSELKNKRYMEAFTEKSQEFREVCYRLFGYRVDMTCERQYRVLSLYAESPNDFFLFRLCNSGELQLLETEFSKSVAQLIETHLQIHHSIPVFLSSVTKELFSQQTFLPSTPSSL